MSSFRIGTMASSIMFILTVFSMHQFIFCFKSDSYGTFNNISKHNTFDDKQLIFVQVVRVFRFSKGDSLIKTITFSVN